MATEKMTWFSDNFPQSAKPQEKKAFSWFTDNADKITDVYKKNFTTFIDSLSPADTWQTPDVMDGHIRRVREEQQYDTYGIGSEAYEKLIAWLENNKAIYGNYESAEDYGANHEKSVAYRQKLLDNDSETLRGEIAALEKRYNTSLNVDGSRDAYDAMLAETTARLVDEYTRHNPEGLTEEEIHTLAINKAKSDPLLAMLGAESGADVREDPNAVKKELDQKRAELNSTLMLQQEYRLTEEALAATDFAQRSVYDPLLSRGDKEWDALYREVNTGSTGAGTHNVGYMSDAERALFNYHFAVGGADKAEQYLTSIQNALNARKAGEIYENHFENRVGRELLYGLYAGFDSAVTGIKNTFGKKKDFYATNTAQHLSGKIGEEMGEIGWLPSLAYSTTTSIGQMTPALVTAALASHIPVAGAALAPLAGAAVTGTSTYGNAYAEMINNGYSAKQANTYALLSGASEAGLEMLMGGFGSLRATKPSGILVSLANKLDDGLFKASLVLADSAADEFTEEALQQLLEPVFKSVATGVDDPNLEHVDWGQVLYAGVLGAVTAGVMNGTGMALGAAKNSVSTALQGRRLEKQNVSIEGLKALGEALPADTVAHKIASKVTEDTGAYTMARLFNAVGAELTRQNQADIVDNLTRKGVLTKDAETIAAYLAAAVNGVEFTARQAKAVENNPIIAEAMRETIIDPDSSVNRRMQNFRDTAFLAPAETESSAEREKKFSIATLPDGRRYVQADRQVIHGDDPTQWEQQITEYINALLPQNGGELLIPTADGDTLTINGRTAWKMGYRNDTPDGGKIDDALYRVKGDAAGHIDELAEVSAFKKSKANLKPNRRTPFAQDGFDYRTAFFRDKDGAYYQLTFSVGKDGAQKTVYNIGDIKKVPFPVTGSKAKTGTTPSDTTVPQNGTGVNTQYMQSGAGYATDASRDSGVEIGVRPSAMDDVFKTMSVHRRKKLYAALKEHTGVTIVEDVTLLADGEYDPATQIIRINPNRATPMTVIKHELTHYLESSKLLYGDFMNYAFEQSTAFREWLASKGHTIETMRKEIVDRYAAKGVKLDSERGASADQEILANFAAEVLFTDINALRELGAQRPKLLQRLKHFVMGIIRRFSGTPAETELERLERMFAAALPKAENSTNGGDKKFSIQRDSAGNEVVVVDTDQGIFVGAEPSEYSRIMRRYFNERFKGVTLPLGDNSDVVSMSKKLPGEYAYPHTVLHNQSPEYRAKMKAITELDNLLLTARNHYYSKDTKGNPEATFGWDYYDVEFLCDGMQVSGLINIANSEKGRVFYDITKIKVAPAISERYVALLAHSPFASQEATDTFRITENDPSVNTQYTQDGTKKFIAPEAEVETQGNQLTDEELLAELRRRGMSDLPNPLQVAQFKPADALTTPALRRIGPMNAVGDGTSAFADSVQNADIFSDELKRLAAEDEQITRYDVITNADTLREANERINTGGRAFVERLMQRDSDTYTTEDMAAAVILLRRYETVGDHESALALMEKLRKAGTKHGQAVQILSLLSRLTPDGMVMYAQKELSQAYEEMVKGQTNQWIAENEDRFKLTTEEMDFIRRRTWQAAQLPKGRDKDIRLAEIAALVQSKIPQRKGQAFKAWQRTAMLLNPKTQLRNVLGNATMVGAFMASDAVGSVLDKVTAKRTGVRTTFAGLNREAVGGMKTGFFESWDDFMRHISTRDIRADKFGIDNRSLDNFNEHHTGFAAPARNKLSRALNALDRFNSFLLEAGDRPFYEMWYLHSINGQMAAAGVSEPTADMIEIATLDALERTWQDTNALTKILSNLKNGMNHIQFKGYGLGDAVLKFVKTPANLTKAMVEFSPVGLVKALAVDATRFNAAVKNGRVTPQMQRRFVKNLSNGIVGTFLTMIAAGLAAAGLVTGEQDEDKDVAAFERAVLGYQPYSVKIGNTSWSYDWMQPVGAHVAAMANYFQDKETAELAGEKLNCFNAILSALKSGGRVLFDQSFMQSIHTFLGDDDIVTNTINAILSDINAPVPQLLSQTASALDPTVRTTYEYGNDVQTAINKVLYKLPGARQTLAPSVDVLGNERKQSPNGVLRAFSSYVSPANIGVGYDSAAGQEMYRLYEATGNAAAIAPSAPNYVSTAAGKRTLSADQKAAYQKVMGRTAAEAVESLLGNAAYQALSDEAKVEVLTGIYGYTRQLANNEVLELSLNESAAKVKAAVDGGVPTGLYFVLKQTADSDGNTSISQKEARAILDATEMTREQKAVMWSAFNKSWKNNPYGTYKYY